MIIFSVSAILKSPVTLSGTEKPEFLALSSDDPVQPVSGVSYDLHASAVSGGILITGQMQVAISGICGRCLQPVTTDVTAGNIELFFEIGENQETLDASEDLRAELLLEFPMNILCSDECRGLCPECGTDLNHHSCSCSAPEEKGDMRWSALDDLQL